MAATVLVLMSVGSVLKIAVVLTARVLSGRLQGLCVAWLLEC